MEKFTVTLADNHQTEVMTFTPKHPVGTLQFLHGMAEHMDRYQDLGQYFKALGYKVIMHNHAGHGGLVQDDARGHFDSMQQLVRHSEEILETFRVPDRPAILMGHSMGSLVARRYVTMYPDHFSALILSGTSFFDAKMEAALNILRGMIAVKGENHKGDLANKVTLQQFNRKFRPLTTQADWLSADPEKVQQFVDDPLTGFNMSLNAYKEILKSMKQTQQKRLLKKMNKRMPILLVSGKEDAFSNFGKGIDQLGHLYKGAGIKHVTVQLYSYSRHEVLFESNQTEVMDRIALWLEQVHHD
ncbi:alpha/beta fold hydrolase [Macrococcus brunensis]|uniref:Alpha/beta fold hydrolase n=1 Tax=Macrococcus brunensis TaxID=198483 RepID=A0A4R6BBV9_9STAP|nr:alpha/beta fold hydrolase [Macrococcus brunensis]TDL95330.1 alpha/beta fold hydrolase [Macrococcus brunensis]